MLYEVADDGLEVWGIPVPVNANGCGLGPMRSKRSRSAKRRRVARSPTSHGKPE